MAGSGGSRMKKPCDCCKRYLDHLDKKDQNMSCFLRRMTSNSKHSMIVPKRFLKNFGGKVLGTIKLESPNSNQYDVEVTERLNKTMLRHGWEAFVNAHCIEENDILLFRHIEKSCFEVLIFDSDGFEKVFPCSGIKGRPNVGERSVGSVDISSSFHHATIESSGSDRSLRSQSSSSRYGEKTAKMAAMSLSSAESGDNISSGYESFESDDLQAAQGPDYNLSCRSYLSETQKERVIALIHEIQPEITVFVAVMRKSHVQAPAPYLGISKEYALAHFPHETTNVTIQKPGRSKKWHPRFYKRKQRSMYMLRGQWLDFIRDNHVQEGDICVLLPTKGARKFTITVHLLRATATHSRGEQFYSESNVHEISHGSMEHNDSGGPSEPPYFVPCNRRLSKSQKKIVERKVRAIQSDVPIYVAIMGKSSAGASQRSILELGSRYATSVHLPARGQTVVLQCRKKIWEAKMVIQHGRRWILNGGWPKFVRDNGLRVGDICLFELKKNDRKLTMMVLIISREQF